jgi:hypothetical protein
MDDLYTEDNSPVDLNLKVISEFNLMLLKNLAKEERLQWYGTSINDWSYGKIRLQQTQIYRLKEEMIAVFGYVREVLMCTNITLYQRISTLF